MPMNINGLVGSLMTFGLLTSQVSGYAQVYNFEEFQATQQPVNTLPIDSILASNQCKPGCSNFNAKQLILPGALIVAGTFGVYNRTFKKLDMNIKNRMDHLRGNHFIHVDDCIQYLPALTYLTLGSIGINSKHGFKERIVVAATAYTTMTALTNILRIRETMAINGE